MRRVGFHKDAMVFGYLETDSDFATCLSGFLAEEVTTRWSESVGDLAEIPEGDETKDVIIELEEVFHLD